MQIKELVTKSAAFDNESYSVVMTDGSPASHLVVTLIQKDDTQVTVSITRGQPLYIDFKGIAGTPGSPVLCGQSYRKS